MKNGTYKVRLRATNTISTIVINNDKARYENGSPFSLHNFQDLYEVIEELNVTRKYNLYWIVNGICKEIIKLNAPYQVARWKAQQLKSTTHTFGLLQPRVIA